MTYPPYELQPTTELPDDEIATRAWKLPEPRKYEPRDTSMWSMLACYWSAWSMWVAAHFGIVWPEVDE